MSKPAGKCSHGGTFFDGTSDEPPIGGINKDTTSCEDSPHFNFHIRAGAAAVESTKNYIRNLSSQLTQKQLKALLGVAPTLAFAIDTTGSMGSVIEGVKQQAIQIVDSRLGTDKEPSKYVLVPFSDPSVGPIIETDDPVVFKNALNSLSANGGGDCPELSMRGELQALTATDEGGDLFVHTDASAKDSAIYRDVNALATSKEIKVNHLIYGTCSPIDPAYINISNNSGGQLFFLQRSEANNITKLTDFLVQPNAVDLVSIGDNLSGAKTYTIPVDSTLSKVTFSVSGTTSVQVKRPDGSVVQTSNPGVTFVGLTSGAIYSIDDPADGEWTVNVSGSGTFSLKTTGESTLGISSLNFVEEGGRPGHGGFFPIAGFPELGSKTIINALLSENVGTAQFELRTKAGAVLQTLNLARGEENTALEFFGEVMLPNTDFLIYVKGTDLNGIDFQRVIATTYKPQSVKIEAPEAKELPAGATTSYTFKVTNLGSSEAFSFTASDDKSFVKSVSPSNFTLATNETKELRVELMPPANTPVGTSDTLTVSVQGLTSGSNNFAVVTSSTATGNLPPNVSQAVPSRNVLFPPNNSMVLVGINNVTDPEGDPVTVKIDRIMQDEIAEEVPNPVVLSLDPCPDVGLMGGSSAFLRAQRSIFGNGRVYTIFFTATDGNGGSSQGSVKVSVPRNATSNAVDDGPSFSSMTCRP